MDASSRARCPCHCEKLTRFFRGCPPLLFVLYCIGSFVESFPLTAYGVWLNEEIKMPLAMQSRFYACIFIPWCLKPLYGWISINYPIRGEHKRPYIIICSVGSAIMYLVTATLVKNYASAFLVTTLRAACNAFAELLLSLILVDHAVVSATATFLGPALTLDTTDTEGNGATTAEKPTPGPSTEVVLAVEKKLSIATLDAAVTAKIGLLQAAATGARNVGTLLALLVGLLMYQCGSYAGISATLVIGLTSAFSGVSCVVAFFLDEGNPKPSDDNKDGTKRCCGNRNNNTLDNGKGKCQCTRKGLVSLSLFLLLQLLVVVTILRTTVLEDEPTTSPSTSPSHAQSSNTTVTPANTTTTTTVGPAFSPWMLTALTVLFWLFLAVMLVVVAVEVTLYAIRKYKAVKHTKSNPTDSKAPTQSEGRDALHRNLLGMSVDGIEEGKETATRTPFWQTKEFLVAAAFIFFSNAMPTASTQWYSFQYATFPTSPCEVQYLSVIGSVASVTASILYARYFSVYPTLLLILSLVSLSAIVSLLRLPLVMAVEGTFGSFKATPSDVSGNETTSATGNFTTDDSLPLPNSVNFTLFAAYTFIGNLVSELATVSVLVFATQMCPGGTPSPVPKKYSKDADSLARDGDSDSSLTATVTAKALENLDSRNRGLYYAIFLSFLDVGDSVSDWVTAPLVTLMGITFDNFSHLGYLLDVESACALIPLLFIPFLMAMRRQKNESTANTSAATTTATEAKAKADSNDNSSSSSDCRHQYTGNNVHESAASIN